LLSELINSDLDVTAEDLEEIELKLGQMSIERATKVSIAPHIGLTC
jgi:hypothetical protein